MIEKWSNQLLYGGSDLIDDLTEHVKKQEENYIMDFLQKMSNGDILSASRRTQQVLSEYLTFKMDQPVQIAVEITPFANDVNVIINSTNAGMAKILEVLAGYHNTEPVLKFKNGSFCEYMPSTSGITKNMNIDVDKVIFNKRTTVVLWKDGTKTKIRCSEKDKFDEETAVAICMLQKILGKGYKRSIRDILKTKAKRYE